MLINNPTWRIYARLLDQYLKPLHGKLALLAALVAAEIGLQLANPQIVRVFLDRVASSGAQSPLLFWAAAVYLGANLLLQGVKVAVTYLGDDVGWRATDALRGDLAEHCLHLDMRFHHAHTPGEMIERTDGDISLLGEFFSTFIMRVAGSILLLAGVLVLLFFEHWGLGILFTGFAAFALFIFTRVEGRAAPRWQASREASAAMYGFVEERLAGLDDLRANGALPYTQKRFDEVQHREVQLGQAAVLASHLLGAFVSVVLNSGTLVALAFGVYLFQRGILSLGGVYLITQYSRLILHPLQALSFQIDDLQKVGAAVARTGELMQTTSTLVDGRRVVLQAGAFTVDLDDVAFSYTSVMDGKDIDAHAASPLPGAALTDIRLHLPAGQVLGVLGRTGSGKTTLARMLFRLYDPTRGVIKFNGIPLPDMSLAALRRNVGLVTQDVQLWEGTLRDNVTFFDHAVTDAQILAALDALGLRPWLASLPSGLETRLGTGGAGLSAGEAQLLAFTRVFLKDPRLIILDEASARLDPATEQLLTKAMDRLLAPNGRRRTAIIIAHRLSTIRRADQILILENGRMKEFGPYQVLADDPNSIFARLLNAAQAGEKKEASM